MLTPSPPGRSRSFREAFLIGFVALTLNLAGNGQVSLFDRDEPRYAACTREMRESGDWIHPTFNAEPRYHKPVLIYWLMLAGTSIGGDNPFGARLASAVMGAATVVLVWAWGRKAIGENAGRLAALVLASAPIVVAESKMATTDSTLTFFIVVCQMALWQLSQRDSWRMALVFWTSLGLAILTKSPAAPVLIGASAAVSFLCGGPLVFVKRLRWKWGPLLCAAIFVPWNLRILLDSSGEYYNVAVGYHIIRRATTGIEDHGGFPGYYIAVGMLSFFPWSALLPGGLIAAWRTRKETPMAGFLIGWTIGPLILLECVRTKLIHYYVPAFPAAALLVGWQVDRLIASGSTIRNWSGGRFALGMLAIVGAAASVSMIVVSWRFPDGLRAPCLVIGATLAVSTVWAVRSLWIGRTDRAVRGMFGFTATGLLLASTWLLPSAEPYRISAVVGRRLAALESSQEARSVLCTFQFPGMVYTLGHPATIVKNRGGLIDEALREGRVVTALLPNEVRVFRKDPRLSIEVLETVEGFNLDKARPETLFLSLVRPTDLAVKTTASQGVKR